MSGHSWHLTETCRSLISRALRMDDWPRAYFPLQSFSENEVPERVPLLESMAPSEKAGLESETHQASRNVLLTRIYIRVSGGFFPRWRLNARSITSFSAFVIRSQ